MEGNRGARIGASCGSLRSEHGWDGGPVARGGAVRGEEGEQPAFDAERDARARGGRAVREANVERLAEEALVQVERGGGDAVAAHGEAQLLLESLEALEQRAPARGGAEERVRRLLQA